MINVSFAPTKAQIAEIKSWLLEERRTTGEGFYGNWNLIASSFSKKSGVIISLDNEIAGFATWNILFEITATIDIVEIKTSHRNKGLGKLLILKVFELLKLKNIHVVSLQCTLPSTKVIWRRLGFTDFPKHISCDELYRILVPFADVSPFCSKGEFIELWDNNQRIAQNSAPAWTWKLEFKDDCRSLITPIIHPYVYDDWRMCWRKNGQVIKDNKAKTFGGIKFGRHLIIRDMPLTAIS